jgi:quercetin 2,3-dioxygenase
MELHKMIRKIKKILKPKETIDGAGVKLKRVFGYFESEFMDPFLMFDNFGSDNPEDYIAGFPWHPHRGIETVTYMIDGIVEHSDSLGNKGMIKSGDIQWMTAGSGIIHQEMPESFDGIMQGFQLWVNLPSSRKMIKPKYQDIKNTDVREILVDKIKIKIISGSVHGISGPVKDIFVDPLYLDITIPSGSSYEFPVNNKETVFVYIFEGMGFCDEFKREMLIKNSLVLFEDGDKIKFTTESVSMRFILAAGKPIREPIAWRGPIVMNTEEELDLAYKEFFSGNFVKN